jgi:hypothetical protein
MPSDNRIASWKNLAMGAIGLSLGIALATLSAAADLPVPPDFQIVAMGESATLPGNGSITVADFATDQPVSSETLEGPVAGVAAWFRVKVCAGGTSLEGYTSEANFSLSRKVKTGFETRYAAPHPAARMPPFATEYVPSPIDAGSCREGWVSVVAMDESTVLEGANAILFNPSMLGITPPEQQAKIAWLLD